MAKKANRKIIGGFVLIAVAIFAVSIVIFGSGDFFKEKAQYVLYFDESVRGLNAGAPVLFNGVEVGRVTRVVMRSNLKDLTSTIPVYIEIYPDSYEVVGEREDKKPSAIRLTQLIELGLRAQLVSQSLVTGSLLIELNMHPDTPVSLKQLDARYPEVPTIPSVKAALGEELKKLDLAAIGAGLTSVLDRILALLNEGDFKGILNATQGTITDTRALVNNLNSQMDALTDNLSETLTEVRRLISHVDEEVKPLSSQAQSALNDVGQLARNVDAEVTPVSKALKNALNNTTAAVKSIDSLVGKKSGTRADLDAALQELARAAVSLRTLADYLEQHPEALLRGKNYTGY